MGPPVSPMYAIDRAYNSLKNKRVIGTAIERDSYLGEKRLCLPLRWSPSPFDLRSPVADRDLRFFV